MTALADPPQNGRVLPGDPPGGPSRPPARTPTAEVTDPAHVDPAHVRPALDLGLPPVSDLDTAIAHARSIVERQGAPELRAAMQFKEIQEERDVDREHRTQMLQVQRERNAATVARARSEMKQQSKLEERALRDELDASTARALLTRMTNPVAYLASQIRARRVALALGVSPAVVGVLLGAVQSQEAWVRLWEVTSIPLQILLYGLEPLATLPLVAVLVYEAATPGGSVRTMKEMWLSTADFAGTEIQFGRIKIGLLIASILINVLPHLLLGELSGLAWLAVPAAIVVSLFLVPKLAMGFGERIINARSDAEMGAPVGVLPPDLAKLARQKRWVEQCIKDGTYQGQLDEKTQLPSVNGIRKLLVKLQGAAGMPDAQRLLIFMGVERGFLA